MKNIYITTAIPYVNGAPHLGHAMDYCLADTCARYQKMLGNNVRLQAGTDEHGGKIYQKAKDLDVPVEEYVKENAERFQDFIRQLGVEYTDYVRTTDSDHERRCQEIWNKLKDHIYLEKYEGWYCAGCERFVTDKEYEENHGICPDHQKSYEHLEEENYYLRLSDFKDEIVRAIESGEMEIAPYYRRREILKLIADSPDVSISRPREQLTWGVPVPGDESQVMYVWIDALSNYITVLGYPEKDIADFWPAYAQFVGKDILRFHAIIWPAMLMGLGLPLPRHLISHGMVLADGQKMSKSIGNVVDPVEVLNRHGLDAFRYYFLRHVDTFADADYTAEKFEDAYNNELANDLGNLVQRLATLAKKNNFEMDEVELELPAEYKQLMDSFEFSKAFDYVWDKVQNINRRIDEEKPWSLAKNGESEKLKKCLTGLTNELLTVNMMLAPFLPTASEKIKAIFTNPIEPPEQPLFPKS
ncbi:methionine--tRNA ligase [Candidatus Saccharibacteria bacterium]|nr:methionine--tRNA ligase [Candidatus Saccharibacteria bacterium]